MGCCGGVRWGWDGVSRLKAPPLSRQTRGRCGSLARTSPSCSTARGWQKRRSMTRGCSALRSPTSKCKPASRTSRSGLTTSPSGWSSGRSKRAALQTWLRGLTASFSLLTLPLPLPLLPNPIAAAPLLSDVCGISLLRGWEAVEPLWGWRRVKGEWGDGKRSNRCWVRGGRREYGRGCKGGEGSADGDRFSLTSPPSCYSQSLSHPTP